MQAEWRPIRSFPGYSVSDTGFVRNDDTDRMMTLRVNQSGVVHVGLTKGRVQYRRAVGILVATAFIPTRPNDSFDCTINLDGDRYNNHFRNLMWRPKWFATRYFQQFKEERITRLYPVEDITIERLFDTPWDAALELGLLHQEVLLSAHTQCLVWPIRHRFRALRDGADITSLRKLAL
jgi:hypothetical protein